MNTFPKHKIIEGLSEAVSRFAGISPKVRGSTTWSEALKEIRTGKHRDQVEHVRQVLRDHGPDAYREAKQRLPAVTFGGTFSYRKNKFVTDTTGFIVADLDHLPDIECTFSSLFGDENLCWAFRSPSGEGIKVGLRAQGIRTDADHKRLYAAVAAYFLDRYSIEIDSACKDICRLTFLSHDPGLWQNEAPVFFDIGRWTPKPEAPPAIAPAFARGQGKKRYAEKVLETACRHIRESAPGEQHETRRNMARLIGGHLHHGLDESLAIAELERAVVASGARDIQAAMRTVQDGLEHGKLNPCTIPDKAQPSSALAKPLTPGEDATSFLPPPPRVPVEVFPAVLQEIIRNAARAFVVPLEVPVCAVLALASACIGRARGIIIKEGWTPHANLYLALVGLSGTGKSPCANAILKSAYRVDFEMHREWQQASADYLLEKEKYREAVRQYRKGEIQDPGLPPEKPKRRQVLVDDATVESLTDALADNPRGILWIRDELAGLLLDLDKYQGEKGSTKTRLMSSYDSGPWKVGRVNQERNSYIPHATLSIFGTVQPAALADIFCGQDAATGFLPRFLFVRFVPDRPGIWTDHVFSKSRRAELDQITRALLALDFDSAGQPKFIGVKKDAKDLYVVWHDRLAMEAWMGTSDDENSVLSKLRDQCLRLALILHLLRAVTEEQSDTAPVTAETMGKAIQLADWFREHQRHAWALIGSAGHKSSEAAPLERRVAQAILVLQGEIAGAALPTSRITEQVNAGVEKAFQLDARAIGKACRRLGLSSKPTNTARMTVIDEAALARLRTLVGSASTRKGGGDVCDVSEKNVTAENPHGSRASDMSDVCDVSQGADMKTADDPPAHPPATPAHLPTKSRRRARI